MATTRIAQSALHVGLVSAALLLVPAVAMQFKAEVAWGLGDFVAVAALLFCAGMAFVLESRRAKSTRQRAAVGVIVFGTLAVVRAELAVGVFLSVLIDRFAQDRRAGFPAVVRLPMRRMEHW